METQSPTQLGTDWIDAWSGEAGDIRKGEAACALDGRLPWQKPELCLEAIVEVLKRIDATEPNHLLSVLAAGPLESVLAAHGPAVVDKVELLARASPEFRLLLNGVWSSTISPEVLARLSKYRTQPW